MQLENKASEWEWDKPICRGVAMGGGEGGHGDTCPSPRSLISQLLKIKQKMHQNASF